MKINKKEIIEELLHIEPSLKKNRKKLEKIWDDFILSKPKVKISQKFKEELKNNLLLEINKDKKKSYIKSNFINIKNMFSFLLGGALMYGFLGMMGINFTTIDNIDKEEITKISQMRGEENILKNTRVGDTPQAMMMDNEEVIPNDTPQLMIMDAGIEENPDKINQYYNEIKDILREIGFTNEHIEQIIEYIKQIK